MPCCTQCKTWGVNFRGICKKCKKIVIEKKKEKITKEKKNMCNHFFSSLLKDETTGKQYKKCFRCKKRFYLRTR